MPTPENIKFRVTADHITLLKNLCFRTAVILPEDSARPPFEVCPDVNRKRPFGNSGCYAHSVLEALGREPDHEDDYSDADEAYARQLLIELPVAYEAVMAHGAIEPCIEPVDRHSALFEYKSRCCLEYWRDAVMDFNKNEPEYTGRLVEFLMNARSDTPMCAVDDLASWAGSCYWAKKALEAMRRQAIKDFRAAHPEHARDSDEAVMNGLTAGAYALCYGPSNVLYGMDDQKGDNGDGEG